MSISIILTSLLAMGAPPGQSGQTANPTAQLVNLVMMFVLMGVIFYFMLIRPQKVRAKQHDAMLRQLKAGDKIVTSGGIVAVVITVKEKTVSIRSADAKMEILKSAVTEVERAAESS